MADDGLRKDVGEAVNSDVVPKNGNTFTPDPEYGGGIEGDDVEVRGLRGSIRRLIVGLFQLSGFSTFYAQPYVPMLALRRL